MKIVFMGTPDFSSNILEALINNNYDIVGVVTKADKPVGRKKEIIFNPVKKVALANNIKILQPVNIKEEYQDILDLNPDLIITCAYGQIVSKEVLDFPKYGCINIHASLLPKYRGGAPIHYAIINGEKETGVTIMKMVTKMDAGDIITQKSLKILETDTTETLFDKLSELGKDLILKTIDPYINNEIISKPQDESLVTYAFNIKKEDEFINFNRDIKEVYNHIRGLISWPVGYGIIEDIKIKFHKVSYKLANNTKPGLVYGIENGFLKIGTIDGYILVEKLQVAGKQVVLADAFYNGYKSKVEGKIFHEHNKNS